MKKTVKLYDIDSYIQNFTAVVTECNAVDNNKYAIVLDRTAFFPEGGGQTSDTGYINDAKVCDVQIKDGIIYHYTDKFICESTQVNCTLNFDERYRKMQNHSGEHIVSGLIYKHFGLNNVGFHLGDTEVLIDFDGELSRENLNFIEDLANKAIYKNIPIICEYPPAEKLSDMNYRSKLSLTEDVRIVTIPEYDCCACCAPHLNNTGEIGIIKLLDFARHKGGVRIHMHCGYDAVKNYRTLYENNLKISNLLCAKQNETAMAVQKFQNDYYNLKQKNTELKKELAEIKINYLPENSRTVYMFENGLNIADMRTLANKALKKCNLFAVFCENNNGFTYVVVSDNTDVSEFCKNMNSVLNGKGGGNGSMIQGSVSAGKEEIERYFISLDN